MDIQEREQRGKKMWKYICAFLAGYAVLLTAMGTALAMYPKAELHMLMNSHHTETLDILFKNLTQAAEWPLYVIGALPLLFWKSGLTYIYALSEVTSAIVTFIIKRIFSMPRPIVYFEDLPYKLPLVDGVAMRKGLSFPSGHTATFFVFFTILAFFLAYMYTKKGERSRISNTCHMLIMFTLLALPTLGGYSRIYVSQHFLMDVFAGSIIGVSIPFMYFKMFYKRKWFEKRWFNRSIFGYDAYYPIGKKKE